MINIWCIETSFATHMKFAVPGPDGEDAIDIIHNVYNSDLKSFDSMFHGGRIGDRPSPAAKFVLKLQDFDADYFTWGGCMFVIPADARRHGP